MVGSLEAVDTRSGDWKTELEAEILGMTPEILMTPNTALPESINQISLHNLRIGPI